MKEFNTKKLLEGKVAVITGAGSGIGKSILERFLAEGAKCIAVDLNDKALDNLKQELSECTENMKTYKADVSSRIEVENMIDFCIKEFGQMDILINNAGIMDNLEPIAEMEDELWQKLMRINLDSVMYGSRYAVQYFLNNDRKGNIVNTASLSGLYAARGGTAYTASKYAVVGLTKNIAFMYADKNIRCNAVCPSSTKTSMTENIDLQRVSKLGLEKSTTGISGVVRNGEPEEIAAAVLFLASDESSFINGETIVLDGGWSAY